jgi:hypothetical protein
MKTVQITDDVYAGLQRLAVPFEDEINDVLRRLLRQAGEITTPLPGRARSVPVREPALTPAPSNGNAHAEAAHVPDDLESEAVPRVVVHKRTTNGGGISQSAYRSTVLGIMRTTSDPISLSDILKQVEHQLADRMTEHDAEMLAAGITRWQSQARNALTQLQYEGRIESVGDGWYQYRP